MKDFILYARNNIAPEISDEAVEGLVQVCSILDCDDNDDDDDDDSDDNNTDNNDKNSTSLKLFLLHSFQTYYFLTNSLFYLPSLSWVLGLSLDAIPRGED